VGLAVAKAKKQQDLLEVVDRKNSAAISNDTFLILLRARLVSIAALLRRYLPSPHPLVKLVTYIPAFPSSD
jgi:hypothetical protein